MNNKYIDEIHKIREDNYEATKNMTFEQRQESIHKGALEFLKIVEQKKLEKKKAIM